MRQLLDSGWSQSRIVRELDISRHTVGQYLALGTLRPFGGIQRASMLGSCKYQLQQQFEQHHDNAEVLRRVLLKQKGIRVSLSPIERVVQAWRESLQAFPELGRRFCQSSGWMR